MKPYFLRKKKHTRTHIKRNSIGAHGFICISTACVRYERSSSFVGMSDTVRKQKSCEEFVSVSFFAIIFGALLLLLLCFISAKSFQSIVKL